MILAADPGSVKTGLALLTEDGSPVWKKIIQTDHFENEIKEALSCYDIKVFVMGNGTHHKEMKARAEKIISSMGEDVEISVVNEKYTTEMGEKWYWKDHPPKGIKRLIPEGFRTVPVPVDDYVAWIIGCIYLGIVKEEDIDHKKL